MKYSVNQIIKQAELGVPHSAHLGTQLWLSSSLQVNLQVGQQSGIIIVRNRPTHRLRNRPDHPTTSTFEDLYLSFY